MWHKHSFKHGFLNFIQKRQLFVLLLLLLSLSVLAGCQSLTLSTQPPLIPGNSEPATGLPVAESSQCPEPAAGQALHEDLEAGYCFLFPIGFEVKRFENVLDAVVYGPETTPGHRERLLIEVRDGVGRTLAQVMQQHLTDYQLPGLEYVQFDVIEEALLGNVPAVIFDNMPGQELNRQVITVVNDRLYRLTFVPIVEASDSADRVTASQEMAQLYQDVMASFVALTPTAAPSSPFQVGENGYPAEYDFAWMRNIVGEGIDAQCQQMVIADGTTYVGSCQRMEKQVDGVPFQWQMVQSHLQPFFSMAGGYEYTQAIRGEGDAYSMGWQRALAQWGAVSYAETMSGQVSATGRTIFSWNVGAVPGDAGNCRLLTVLGHGYAYANVVPCAGGDVIASMSRWLTTPEVDRLMDLYVSRSTYSDGLNTFDGRGIEPLTEAEISELAGLADHIFQTVGD